MRGAVVHLGSESHDLVVDTRENTARRGKEGHEAQSLAQGAGHLAGGIT